LIVYHLDKTVTGQLAEIGLKPRDITRVAISHTHGDHIGNVRLFPDSMILMPRAEHSWINSGNGPNDNVNRLMALARELLGTPKNLQLLTVMPMCSEMGASFWLLRQGTPPAASRCWSISRIPDSSSFRRRRPLGREFREKHRSCPQYRQGNNQSLLWKKSDG
jgi:hypothetical protein